VSEHRRVPVIGLIGGIGSGKSAVASWVVDNSDVVVIDGDKQGHLALQQTGIKKQVRQQFGNEVFDNTGEIDRTSLAKKVFGPSIEHQNARTKLEQIVHPEIKQAFREIIFKANSSGTTEAVILDAAVLLEAGWDSVCDLVVFIETSEHERLNRVRDNRNWKTEEFHSREANQLSLESKRNRADIVISNSGDIATAGTELTRVIQQLSTQS
jgi:dephospho-CoA kinase